MLYCSSHYVLGIRCVLMIWQFCFMYRIWDLCVCTYSLLTSTSVRPWLCFKQRVLTGDCELYVLRMLVLCLKKKSTYWELWIINLTCAGLRFGMSRPRAVRSKITDCHANTVDWDQACLRRLVPTLCSLRWLSLWLTCLHHFDFFHLFVHRYFPRAHLSPLFFQYTSVT